MKKFLLVVFTLCLVLALVGCSLLGGGNDAEKGWKKIQQYDSQGVYTECEYIHFHNIKKLMPAYENVWDGTIWYSVETTDPYVTVYFKYTIKTDNLQKVEYDDYMFAYMLAHGNDEEIVYRGTFTKEAAE